MTHTTTDAAEARALTVIQADRDAAADFMEYYRPAGWKNAGINIRKGAADKSHSVLFFARHRLATAEAASGAGERRFKATGEELTDRLQTALFHSCGEITSEMASAIAANLSEQLRDGDEDWGLRLSLFPDDAASLPPATDPAMVTVRKAWEALDRELGHQLLAEDGSAYPEHTDMREAIRALAAAPAIPATGEFRLTFGDWYEAKQGDAVPIGWYQWRNSEGREYGPFHNEGKLNHPGAEDPVFTAGVTGCRQGFKVATIPATGHAATEGKGA